MGRITKGMLERKADYLNKITGNPSAPWTRGEDGRLTGNIGNYHLNWAYGGVELVQMATEDGAIRGILEGYCSKRELYEKICAFIDGIEAADNA